MPKQQQAKQSQVHGVQEDKLFDTSGLDPAERENVIRKKRNLHRDPKKHHRDTYVPPIQVPDEVVIDERPI